MGRGRVNMVANMVDPDPCYMLLDDMGLRHVNTAGHVNTGWTHANTPGA